VLAGKGGTARRYAPMMDFLTAIGLVLVIEGSLYALMPDAMKRMMAQVQSVPTPIMRVAGLGAAAAGVLVVWWIRHR